MGKFGGAVGQASGMGLEAFLEAQRAEMERNTILTTKAKTEDAKRAQWEDVATSAISNAAKQTGKISY